MNVVMDVSVIGLGQLFETARTGIYRVISSLATELLARGGRDLFFTALSSIQVNQLTDDYFSDKGFRAKAFPRTRLEKLLVSWSGYSSESSGAGFRAKICSKLYRMSLTQRIGERADIFHSHYSPLPRFGSGRKPVRMLTVYDIIPLIHPEYFVDGFAEEFRPIVESFSPGDDFLFTISENTRNDICSYFGMDPERVFVTPLAASPEVFHPVEDPAWISEVKKLFHVPEGRYFLTLATVEKRKNLRMCVDCFREILREPGSEDLFFVLVGTRGWKVDDVLEDIARDPVLKERVIFTGFVPDRYLSALYSGAEAFLYLSLYEGFGLPPLEAMQCGLPVIASNTSSLPEVVGDNGILVDPQDRDLVCDAMLRILRDEQYRGELAARSLTRAGQFTWQRCADLTVAGYETAWAAR